MFIFTVSALGFVFREGHLFQYQSSGESGQSGQSAERAHRHLIDAIRQKDLSALVDTIDNGVVRFCFFWVVYK